MKIEHWVKYPRTDLKRITGFPFDMAWVYLPSGIEIFTGDSLTIGKYLSEYPILQGVKKASKKTLEYF